MRPLATQFRGDGKKACSFSSVKSALICKAVHLEDERTREVGHRAVHCSFIMKDVCMCAVLCVDGGTGRLLCLLLFIISGLLCVFVCVFYSGHICYCFKLEINNHKQKPYTIQKKTQKPPVMLPHKD